MFQLMESLVNGQRELSFQAACTIKLLKPHEQAITAASSLLRIQKFPISHHKACFSLYQTVGTPFQTRVRVGGPGRMATMAVGFRRSRALPLDLSTVQQVEETTEG